MCLYEYEITRGSCTIRAPLISSFVLDNTQIKFWWKVDRSWWASSMALTLTGPQFSFWWYLKCLVYATSVHDLAKLQQCVENVVKQLEGGQGFLNVYNNPWVKICVEMGGQHIQHLLLWYIQNKHASQAVVLICSKVQKGHSSKTRPFQAHVCIDFFLCFSLFWSPCVTDLFAFAYGSFPGKHIVAHMWRLI
jgi:hypothetical protein